MAADRTMGNNIAPTSRSHMQQYIGIWLAVAIVLGAMQTIAERARNPLNDPDEARQRTGMLLPAHTYPSPAIDDLPKSGRRTLIFFARSLDDQFLFHDLADQADLSAAADLIVITRDGSRPRVTGGIKRFVADPDGAYAQAFGLAQPIDGGAPVGYVIVDSEGYIRYRTLDPRFTHHAKEIQVMIGATP